MLHSVCSRVGCVEASPTEWMAKLHSRARSGWPNRSSVPSGSCPVAADYSAYVASRGRRVTALVLHAQPLVVWNTERVFCFDAPRAAGGHIRQAGWPELRGAM